MASSEGFRYNGVHLRLEADASRWIAANGGVDKTWGSYVAACRVRRLGPRALGASHCLLK